ncbi:Cation-transporting P-type ATPase [Cynara cardunculus var. scolymus]|uniref:Phospholipid-transporting ATPase n=1 Tax=Cynara cardunculus var. scolymus TaxID=59895 RepID=A0A103XVD5_CYNCS|nr:Cation-transporting P-type ATPase [Cynara cardunculus var. scolymus]
MGKGRRKTMHLSKMYSLRRSGFEDDHSQIGGPGFSRVVYCNEMSGSEGITQNYADNYVRLTKYTPFTFLPKSLFEQFRRVANFYFLVTGILAFTALAPYSAVSAVIPLIIVVGATMSTSYNSEISNLFQDHEVNNRKVKVHRGGGVFESSQWKKLRVGDVVKVEKDEFFPADLLLISSSYDDAICYVETMNLDGETNLKLKQSLDVTSLINEDSKFNSFKATVRCEDPNASLYTFVGTMQFQEQRHALSPQQLLLRDSKLRNTDYIYGVVIFTGHDTKVIQNSTDPPSKRSKIEKRTDSIIYFLFFVLFLMAFVGSVYFGITTRDDLDGDRMKRWYLGPDRSEIFFDPKRAPMAAIYHFLTAVMLYSYLIPISLYVSIEVVKVLQTLFINNDVDMYYEEADKPAHARTSNLTEELGQIDTILSDKTGTLTCNSMEFIKCSVAGTAYGRHVTEVERAMAKRTGSPLLMNGDGNDDNSHLSVKGYNFEDERITNRRWVHEPHSDVIQKFFRLLAICHTAIPDVDEDTRNVTYEAESPDEAAFVIAARELGFEFYKRTQTSVSFMDARKRMSVIVRDEEGKLLLLCKGADSVMFERLSKEGRQFEENTREHVNEYAQAGLRTLILAYRELSDEEYKEFNEKFTEAKNSVSAERDDMMSEVTDEIEKDLILLGATAVEDKLQKGVRFSRMKQIVITLESPEIVAAEKAGDKSVIAKISAGKAQLDASRSEAHALIIDGKSLVYALNDDTKNAFLELAVGCASVICCRSSPKQKALVTRLVKEGTGKTTLAIGDGANDVGMLQEADIGIGISGVEGMQAVMSSDIAIAQFRFLERLLLVHGHWSYRRISSMGYAAFSGQPAYNDWYLSLYNVFFTSFPFPLLYQEGVQNTLFGWRRIFSWMLNGLCSGVIIFFLCTRALDPESYDKNGKTAGMEIVGATMYTCVVWVVNCQMALAVSYFTLIQHVFIWGGIVLWYLFLLAYGSLSVSISTSAYKVFVETLAPAPTYWLVTLFVVIAALIPYFCFKAIKMRFFPGYHGMVQWIRHEGHTEDPDYCNMVRQRSIRATTVGFTARSIARDNNLYNLERQ